MSSFYTPKHFQIINRKLYGVLLFSTIQLYQRITKFDDLGSKNFFGKFGESSSRVYARINDHVIRTYKLR